MLNKFNKKSEKLQLFCAWTFYIKIGKPRAAGACAILWDFVRHEWCSANTPENTSLNCSVLLLLCLLVYTFFGIAYFPLVLVWHQIINSGWTLYPCRLARGLNGSLLIQSSCVWMVGFGEGLWPCPLGSALEGTARVWGTSCHELSNHCMTKMRALSHTW